MDSNGFVWGSDLALFSRLSRINHCCMPNAALVTCQDKVAVKAVREVAKNEEITISYLETLPEVMLSSKGRFTVQTIGKFYV